MVRWSDLTPDQLAVFGNGCGPSWFPVWLANLMFGWFFDASCRRHDFGYRRGGSRADRLAVDRGFYRAMRQDAVRFSGGKALVAKAVAWLFYRLVRLFGGYIFNYGPYLSKAEILN
jgi:Prokaryotic phospholipase A2